MRNLLIYFIFFLFPAVVFAQSCPGTLSACPSPSYNAVTANIVNLGASGSFASWTTVSPVFSVPPLTLRQ
jgi:hypothetical protein